MLSGDEKGVIFSVLVALSCGVNNFIQEEIIICRFYFIWKPLTKIQNPLEPPQYCQYLLTLCLNVFYIVAGVTKCRYTKFHTCMKNRKIFAICHSTGDTCNWYVDTSKPLLEHSRKHFFVIFTILGIQKKVSIIVQNKKKTVLLSSLVLSFPYLYYLNFGILQSKISYNSRVLRLLGFKLKSDDLHFLKKNSVL